MWLIAISVGGLSLLVVGLMVKAWRAEQRLLAAGISLDDQKLGPSAAPALLSPVQIIVARSVWCSRCCRNVFEWFMESVDHGGAFGSGNTTACLHCMRGWPYPAARETEVEYDTRLKDWRVEQEELDEQERLRREKTS
jgi:alkylhydroperoxidase family enzyme